MYDFLELEGYGPVIRSSEEKAIELVKTNPPDLVLLDIQFPGTDGVDVLRQFKEIDPVLPVIIVRASSQKDRMEKILEYGGGAMVMIPYDQDSLSQVIHDLLCRGVNQT